MLDIVPVGNLFDKTEHLNFDASFGYLESSVFRLCIFAMQVCPCSSSSHKREDQISKTLPFLIGLTPVEH